MNSSVKNFRTNLRYLLESRRGSATELCECIGITKSYLTRLQKAPDEEHSQCPTLDVCVAMSRSLSVSLGDLTDMTAAAFRAKHFRGLVGVKLRKVA